MRADIKNEMPQSSRKKSRDVGSVDELAQFEFHSSANEYGHDERHKIVRPKQIKQHAEVQRPKLVERDGRKQKIGKWKKVKNKYDGARPPRNSRRSHQMKILQMRVQKKTRKEQHAQRDQTFIKEFCGLGRRRVLQFGVHFQKPARVKHENAKREKKKQPLEKTRTAMT